MAKDTTFTSASSKLPALTLSPAQLFIQSQIYAKPKNVPNDLNLSGQTAIITGANNGIGFACAKLLIQHRLSHLILAVRSKEKGNVAAEQLRSASPGTGCQIDVWELDMGSYTSIAKFATRCEGLSRIDFVILNAGMGGSTFHRNKITGHEETMQVNFLSTMYLSILLLPILKAKAPPSKPGRLTIVNSGTSMHCDLPEAKADHIISALDSEAGYDGMQQYSKSKLLGQLFVDKLAQHVNPNNVIINCVDPGMTKGTGLMDKSSGVIKFVMSIVARLFGRSGEQAASTYVDAAITQGIESHGSFLMDWKVYPFGVYFYTEERQEVQNRLWDEVMDEFAFAHVGEIVKTISGSNALVVGGTSGIGYAIAKRIATAPNYHFSAVTIVGRNKPKVMPAEDTSFRAVDASSMHELKQFAQEFRSNASNNPLDLLVMTQGIMTFAGRTETSEGIDRKMALHYYGKQLLIRELSPIMNQNTKVLLVLDGLNGKPEKLNWDDLDLKETFSLANAANHCTVMNDAMVQYYAKLQGEDNKRFFVHAYPGVVDTTTPRNSPWYFRAVSKVASKVIGSTPDQCAERLLDGLYKSAKDKEPQGVFWGCIDNHGKEVQGKKEWSEEETKKIADHTWAIVDGS
ncbi:hypothetical protein KAF25_007717 [Fusarium avenaceum]|uniref:Uncharacterized protein n=1 Tax=Fusarium avenaceum TaxID=40199 RepID=A0A9P7GVL7_9HYPO|nr:hypothetical protein KAF25_007717 [Fusarium avenaceum]